jgi:glycosyltransferase involved in cell wall biosynthesis
LIDADLLIIMISRYAAMHYTGNILFLLNASPRVWRAMEEFHFRLAQAFVESGAQVVIVLAKEVPPDIRARLESSGAIVRFLAYRPRIAFFIGLRRLIRDHSVTAVHIRFFQLTHLVAWMVRVQGVQRVVFTDAEGGEPKARGLKVILKRLRHRITTAPVSRVIAISDFVKARLIESGVWGDRIQVIYNGVDLARFTPDPAGRDRLLSLYAIKPDELILTTVSRLWAIKGVDVLLNACRRLKDRGLRFRFLIAGDGPQEQELKDLCQDLELDDHVEWIGATSEPEMLLRGADIFLLGTTGEAFGNVLVEAMACGVPVIASRSGAIGEIVQDGRCGLLAEPNNPDSFADCIARLAQDPNKRRELAAAALARAREFSVDKSVQETLDVYRSLSTLVGL